MLQERYVLVVLKKREGCVTSYTWPDTSNVGPDVIRYDIEQKEFVYGDDCEYTTATGELVLGSSRTRKRLRIAYRYGHTLDGTIYYDDEGKLYRSVDGKDEVIYDSKNPYEIRDEFRELTDNELLDLEMKETALSGIEYDEYEGGYDEVADEKGLAYGAPADKEAYKQFLVQSLRTKKDVCEAIEKEYIRAQVNSYDDAENSTYYERLCYMFFRFRKKIGQSYLFDAPEGMWQYVIEYDCYGIRLYLRLVDGILKEYRDDNNDYYELIGVKEPEVIDRKFIIGSSMENYLMVDLKSEMITVDRFAEIYEVKPVTVYQWIRRGKIRSAVKMCGEWRIPELADTPNAQSGYKPAEYLWNKKEVTDFPEEYKFLSGSGYVGISKVEKQTNAYELSYSDENGSNKKIFTAAEREKLELFLISHPLIKINEASVLIDEKIDIGY